MNDLNLPLPKPTLDTAPFWKAAQAHRLVVQRCTQCGSFRFYPCAACNKCASTDFTWVETSGKGRVYSWIVVHRTVDPAWQGRTPFVSAIVEIAEQPGVLIPGLLTEMAAKDVKAGLSVEVFFEDLTPDISVPRWRPTVLQGEPAQ